MKRDVRRAIAYIAGRAISKVSSSYIYDYETNENSSFSGTVTPHHINVLTIRQARI